jgi:hypothetical protein
MYTVENWDWLRGRDIEKNYNHIARQNQIRKPHAGGRRAILIFPYRNLCTAGGRVAAEIDLIRRRLILWKGRLSPLRLRGQDP